MTYLVLHALKLSQGSLLFLDFVSIVVMFGSVPFAVGALGKPRFVGWFLGTLGFVGFIWFGMVSELQLRNARWDAFKHNHPGITEINPPEDFH